MEGQGVGIHNINTIMGAEMSLYIQEKSLRLSLSIVEAVVVKEKGKLRTDYRPLPLCEFQPGTRSRDEGLRTGNLPSFPSPIPLPCLKIEMQQAQFKNSTQEAQ